MSSNRVCGHKDECKFAAEDVKGIEYVTIKIVQPYYRFAQRCFYCQHFKGIDMFTPAPEKEPVVEEKSKLILPS